MSGARGCPTSRPRLLGHYAQRPGAATQDTAVCLRVPGVRGAELGLSHTEQVAFLRWNHDHWFVGGESVQNRTEQARLLLWNPAQWLM